MKIYDDIFECYPNIIKGVSDLAMLLSMHCSNNTGSNIYCHWMVLVLIHVLLHLTCCMVDYYWAACRARKLAFVWALLGSIKTNFNRNAVDFKLVEMVTDPGVHVLRGGQASLHFVLPSEELRWLVAVGFKLGLQQNHIMAINEWRLSGWQYGSFSFTIKQWKIPKA